MTKRQDDRAAQARDELDLVPEQLAAVDRMDKRALHATFAELFGRTSLSQNGEYLRKKIKYRIQELAEGASLSERLKTRLTALADTSLLRQHGRKAVQLTARQSATIPIASSPVPRPRRDARLPAIGTVIRREHRGEVHEVAIVDDGFCYRGRSFTSLSTIAKQITGSIWNGYLFFGLTGRVRERRAAGSSS